MSSNPYTRTSYETHLIDGNVFSATIKLTVAAGATGYYQITNPADTVGRIVTIGRDIVTTSASGGELTVTTGATGVVAGTAVVNKNANTASTKTSGVTLKPVTSITTAGTEIDFVYLPAGGFKAGGNYSGGGARSFAPGSYLVGFKNLATSSVDVYITYTWIQVPTLLDF